MKRLAPGYYTLDYKGQIIEVIKSDVDKETMGLSPDSLNYFLSENAVIKNNQCFNKTTGKIIKDT